ncbi:zinc ribbon domain-containing protein [Enorma massiliensis]|uniref:zinc ribbon domain-containing protein n=1 Tax=Enorma massiliensis TaxID=1472761 RepID=UPI001959E5B4|nr:zinc ribbon domain-containing protein [Enorma massiliensis]MBM6782798.1 zinc ribbon domain-containing protein [Enorma massiliensis]
MFCPKCGSQLADDAKFCGACGAQIQAPANTTPAPGAAPAPIPGPAPTSNPSPVPGPVPTQSSGSSFTPSPISSGSSLGSLAGSLGGILPLARIIVGAVLVICFFLPMYGLYGIAEVSPMQMTFGLDVFGQHVDGSIKNLYYLIPGIVTLAATFLYQGREANIAPLLAGVLGLIFIFITMEDGVSILFGGWLFIIACIAGIAIGALQTFAGRK